jgi:BMFP domain-containing protein YqiC
MLNGKSLDAVVEKLCQALPQGLQDAKQDMEHTFHDILQTAFASLSLVTRHEFDVQTKVLARTREKVELLEKQLTSLLDATTNPE